MSELRYYRMLLVIGVGFVVVASLLLYSTFKLLPFNDALWQESGRHVRGRMVKNLLANTDFTGFSRGEVITWLGAPDFDERLYWYNLGPTTAPHVRSARTPVGDSSQFIIVFQADIQNQIVEVLFDRRPDSLGGETFDENVWQIAPRAERGKMARNLVSHYRWVGHPATDLLKRLGPPDGELFRTHYDVGNAGKIYSFGHALVFIFDETGHVTKFYLQ